MRYAREQYAVGYVRGLHDEDFGQDEALEFARFYVARCDREGGLVDVQDAYRRWRWREQPAQLTLFGD